MKYIKHKDGNIHNNEVGNLEVAEFAGKHTPGPWAADFHGHIMAHGGTTNVASTWTTPDENYPEGRPYKANARLIAAAPELLVSATILLEMLDHIQKTLGLPKGFVNPATNKSSRMEDARAIIAKATGEEAA